ncbi:MAG: serine/threonine protein phosphatase [Planctomycetales bacterium]|nr:serine/threonine protein phosphatase [Planctomycetales bacterium]
MSNNRTIVIGDIHGCSTALLGLFDAVQPSSNDELIFLGDYVDRGPDSKGVLELLIECQRKHLARFLMGNHEIMFRGVLRGLPSELWLEIGGRPTLTSYGGSLDYVPADHQEFLSTLLPYYEMAQHMFVHANYLPELSLSQTPEHTLYWEHLTDRFPGPHFSGKHVFCGHTPQEGGKVGYFGHLTCLDTFCFGGFYLTALDVSSGQIWQVTKRGHVRKNWQWLEAVKAKLQPLMGFGGSIATGSSSSGPSPDVLSHGPESDFSPGDASNP